MAQKAYAEPNRRGALMYNQPPKGPREGTGVCLEGFSTINTRIDRIPEESSRYKSGRFVSPEKQVEYLINTTHIQRKTYEARIKELEKQLHYERAIVRDWREKPIRVIFWNRYRLLRDKLIRFIFGPVEIYED